MITNQQIETYNNLESEKNELNVELIRINDFLARDSQNKDNNNAIKNNKIFVKFAGTGCSLPIGIFTVELTKRKKDINDRLSEIETELINI